jgi:hypothetical protein
MRLMFGKTSPYGSFGPPDSSPLFDTLNSGTQGDGCVPDSSIGGSSPSRYGVDIGATDWYSAALVANFSATSTNRCVMIIQTAQTTSAGVNVNPVILIK